MSFVQSWGNDDLAGATSSGNVTSGNIICGIIFWSSATITLTSISNNRGPNLTLLGNPTAIPDNGWRGCLFYGALTSGGATCTLVATYSTPPVVSDIVAHEYSDIDVAQILSNSGAAWALQRQNLGGGGTGTDAYTSGNLTTTDNGCTIAGFCLDGNVNNTLTAGTGYTARITTQSSDLRADTEDRVQSTAGSIAATFTNSANFQELLTGAFGLKPVAAEVVVERNVPGRRIYVLP